MLVYVVQWEGRDQERTGYLGRQTVAYLSRGEAQQTLDYNGWNHCTIEAVVRQEYHVLRSRHGQA